jgi:hypothetical protein
LKKFSVPANGAVSDDEDDEDDDNHSSIAGGDIASIIDDNQTNTDKNQIESSIVLKQIRRLPSVEPMPPPPVQPTVIATEDNEKSKESNK